MSSIKTITKKYRTYENQDKQIFAQEELFRSKGVILTELGKTEDSSLVYLVSNLIASYNHHKETSQNADITVNCYRAWIVDSLLRTQSLEALTYVKTFCEGLIDD